MGDVYYFNSEYMSSILQWKFSPDYDEWYKALFSRPLFFYKISNSTNREALFHEIFSNCQEAYSVVEKADQEKRALQNEESEPKEVPNQQDNDSFQLNEEQKVQLYEMLNSLVTKMGDMHQEILDLREEITSLRKTVREEAESLFEKKARQTTSPDD